MTSADYGNEILLYSVIWIVTIVLYVVFLRKAEVKLSGLSLIYIANLALIHFFGSIFFILPVYKDYNLKYTVKGFEYSTIALVCFIVGNIFYILFKRKKFYFRSLRKPINSKFANKVPLFLLLSGLLLYVLRSLVGQLPTLTVFLSIGFQLIVVAICLYCHIAYRNNDSKKIYIYVLLSFFIPLFIVITEGFLGYGISMLISIIIFVDNFSKFDTKKIMVLVLLSYFGLSFYINYISDREEFRESVWSGDPLNKRIDEFKNIFTDFEFFNPQKRDHLYWINKRLNQNEIVGVSSTYVNSSFGKFAKGETYKLSIYNLIPRILWKDKPENAGDTELVEKYTGLKFSEDTSVGMPQVMEMYINYGMASLIVGFLLIGAFFSYFDLRSGFYLSTFQYDKFILFFLPPLAFMRSETPITECFATFIASYILVFAISKTSKRLFKPLFLAFSTIILLIGLKIFFLPTINPIFGYVKYLFFLVLIILILFSIGKKYQKN